MILIESYYYMLSISFGYVFCLHMLCIKVYRKTSVGETHHDDRTEFDHENHEIQEIMIQGPRPTKQASSSPWSRAPGLLHGPAGPSQRRLTSRFVHGQVCDPYTLFSPIMLSVSNRIKNPLIKQL